MEDLNLKIKYVEVLLTDGTDRISLYPDLPTGFPNENMELEYDPVFQIECRKNYGETYCKEILKLDNVSIINVRIEKH